MKILRQERIVVILFNDNTHCSKVYNDLNINKACEKARLMEQDIIERNIKERPFTLEELLSKDKKRYKVLHRFHLVQPRFQDKRAVERLLTKKTNTYSKRTYVDFRSAPLMNLRPKELLIPFTLDNRTTIYIRESRIFETKYKEKLGTKFKSDKSLLDYIQAFKNSVIDKTNSLITSK